MNKADILNYFLNNYNDIVFGKINENLNGFFGKWRFYLCSKSRWHKL